MNHYRRQLFKGVLGASIMGGRHLAARGEDKREATPIPPITLVPSATIELWPGTPENPGQAPGLLSANLREVITQGGKDPTVPSRKLRGISRPRMHYFAPEHPNGAAIVVTPGGGYGYVDMDGEGQDIAAWLNAHGIAAFVLLYRLPAEGWANAPDVPLADAQRAIRLVRARADQYGIDPKRVGMMGFSAGGHVAASLGTRYDARVYAPIDAADMQSARPALVAPIYPVISMVPPLAHMRSRTALLGEHPTHAQLVTYSPHQMVTAETPPFFLTHAENDSNVIIDNTLELRAALKAAGVTVETHLFPSGGHGFSLRDARQATYAWGALFLAFARARNLYA